MCSGEIRDRFNDLGLDWDDMRRVFQVDNTKAILFGELVLNLFLKDACPKEITVRICASSLEQNSPIVKYLQTMGFISVGICNDTFKKGLLTVLLVGAREGLDFEPLFESGDVDHKWPIYLIRHDYQPVHLCGWLSLTDQNDPTIHMPFPELVKQRRTCVLRIPKYPIVDTHDFLTVPVPESCEGLGDLGYALCRTIRKLSLHGRRREIT